MVTPEQILLLQETFELIAVDAPGFADRFYTHLFDLNPAVKRMFHSSMGEQGQKLMEVINLAVNGLWSPEAVTPVLEALGLRHVGYGVKERHYALVGASLLWALERDLGPRWTPEAAEAWTAAYSFIAQAMLVGAAGLPRESDRPARRKRAAPGAGRAAKRPRPPADDEPIQPGEQP